MVCVLPPCFSYLRCFFSVLIPHHSSIPRLSHPSFPSIPLFPHPIMDSFSPVNSSTRPRAKKIWIPGQEVGHLQKVSCNTWEMWFQSGCQRHSSRPWTHWRWLQQQRKEYSLTTINRFLIQDIFWGEWTPSKILNLKESLFIGRGGQTQMIHKISQLINILGDQCYTVKHNRNLGPEGLEGEDWNFKSRCKGKFHEPNSWAKTSIW